MGTSTSKRELLVALRGAVREEIRAEHELTIKVATLLALDVSMRAIARQLGVREVEVELAVERLRRIALRRGW